MPAWQRVVSPSPRSRRRKRQPRKKVLLLNAEQRYFEHQIARAGIAFFARSARGACVIEPARIAAARCVCIPSRMGRFGRVPRIAARLYVRREPPRKCCFAAVRFDSCRAARISFRISLRLTRNTLARLHASLITLPIFRLVHGIPSFFILRDRGRVFSFFIRVDAPSDGRRCDASSKRRSTSIAHDRYPSVIACRFLRRREFFSDFRSQSLALRAGMTFLSRSHDTSTRRTSSTNERHRRDRHGREERTKRRTTARLPHASHRIHRSRIRGSPGRFDDWFTDAAFHRSNHRRKTIHAHTPLITHTEMLNCERHAFSKNI